MGIYSRTSNSRYYTRFALKLKSFTHMFKSNLSRRRSALKHKQFHRLATASAIRKRSIARKVYKACHRVFKARAMHAARLAPVPTLVTRSIPQVRGLLILQVSSGKRKRAQREHVSSASPPISPHDAARSSYTRVESEASTSRAILDVEPSSPRSGGLASLPLFPASGENDSARRTSSSVERCDTPEPEEIPHVQPIPVHASAPTPIPMQSLSTRVPYRQPAPPPAKSSSTKSTQPKRRRLANAYKEGVIKSALRRALLAHPRSSSSSVGLGLVAGILARARAAMGVTSSSSSSQPTLQVPVPPSSSSRSIFAPIPTPMPLPAKGTPPSSNTNTQRGVLRPRKRLQLGPWLVLVERRMKLKQVLGGKGKQVVPLPKPRTGLSMPAAKDVKQVLRREGSALVAC